MLKAVEEVFDLSELLLQLAVLGLLQFVDFRGKPCHDFVQFPDLGILQDGYLPEALGVGFIVEVDIGHNDLI
jgi:hypothetical protein